MQYTFCYNVQEVQPRDAPHYVVKYRRPQTVDQLSLLSCRVYVVFILFQLNFFIHSIFAMLPFRHSGNGIVCNRSLDITDNGTVL